MAADLDLLNAQFDKLIDGLKAALAETEYAPFAQTLCDYVYAISPERGPAVEQPSEPPANDPATLILQAASLPTGDPQLTLMNAWIACEGGDPWNNPLNVTAPLDGSWSWPGQTAFRNNLGTMGVVEFDSMVNGASACARVLRQANMSLLYSALSAGDGYQFVTAIQNSPWGTSPACVATKLGVSA